MSFTDPRTADLTSTRTARVPRPGSAAQQPGGSDGSWAGVDVGGCVPGGAVVGGWLVGGAVVGGVVVGGVVGGCVVGGCVVGGVVVGGVVVGGVVGGSVVGAGSVVGGCPISRAVPPAPATGDPAASRQEDGAVVVSTAVGVGVGVAVVGGEVALTLGAVVDVDLTGTQPRNGSSTRVTPSPVEPARSPGAAGAAPATSGARPKIRTSTRTQIDTAPSAISAGADRDIACRIRACAVGAGVGGATSTGLRPLPAPTTAYPMLIRSRPRCDGSDPWYESCSPVSPPVSGSVGEHRHRCVVPADATHPAAAMRAGSQTSRFARSVSTPQEPTASSVFRSAPPRGASASVLGRTESSRRRSTTSSSPAWRTTTWRRWLRCERSEPRNQRGGRLVSRLAPLAPQPAVGGTAP